MPAQMEETNTSDTMVYGTWLPQTSEAMFQLPTSALIHGLGSQFFVCPVS